MGEQSKWSAVIGFVERSGVFLVAISLFGGLSFYQVGVWVGFFQPVFGEYSGIPEILLSISGFFTVLRLISILWAWIVRIYTRHQRKPSVIFGNLPEKEIAVLFVFLRLRKKGLAVNLEDPDIVSVIHKSVLKYSQGGNIYEVNDDLWVWLDRNTEKLDKIRIPHDLLKEKYFMCALVNNKLRTKIMEILGEKKEISKWKPILPRKPSGH